MIKILFVDDIHEDYELAMLRLQNSSKNLELRWVNSAISALELLKVEKFDCVISDYQMPAMDGISFLRSLRQNGFDIPFILVTGVGDEELAAQAFQDGADAYFTKRQSLADSDSLFRTVETLMGDYLQRKENQAESEKMKIVVQAFEQSPGAMLITDFNGDIKYKNNSFTELFGFETDEVRGIDLKLLLKVTLSNIDLDEALQKARKGENWQGQGRFQSKTGEAFDTRIQIFPLRNDLGQKTHLVFIADAFSASLRN